MGEKEVRQAPAAAAEPLFADEAFLEALRRRMVQFAHSQLGDRDAAEDAVQEAWFGALKNLSAFGGRAAFQTWVFAILKHKIADELRRRGRLVGAGDIAADDEESDLTALFDRRGYWRPEERPQRWAEPESALEDQRFWQIFETCLDHLPPRQARAFMMREFVGLDAGEICRVLGITANHLHVLMHRARLRLRECLENRWFGRSEDP